MKQLPLWGMLAEEKRLNRVTNIASVPHRSPFRYPGGKTWLIPQIRMWFSSLGKRPQTLVEPFAGGAIVGLTAVFENLVDHTILVELDDQVAAVWETIINSEYGLWLAKAIVSFDITPASVEKILAQSALNTHEVALQTIIKNRVNRGGILAAGAGRIKYGEGGRGISSRWYPKTLNKRILDIIAIKDRLGFLQTDGLEVIRQYQNDPDAVFFVDPPYTASRKNPGSRLYDRYQLDHEQLFAVMSEVSGSFLMTYDDDPQIRTLAKTYAFEVATIGMKNSHHTRQDELLISANLEWLTIT